MNFNVSLQADLAPRLSVPSSTPADALAAAALAAAAVGILQIGAVEDDAAAGCRPQRAAAASLLAAAAAGASGASLRDAEEGVVKTLGDCKELARAATEGSGGRRWGAGACESDLECLGGGRCFEGVCWGPRDRLGNWTASLL